MCELIWVIYKKWIPNPWNFRRAWTMSLCMLQHMSEARSPPSRIGQRTSLHSVLVLVVAKKGYWRDFNTQRFKLSPAWRQSNFAVQFLPAIFLQVLRGILIIIYLKLRVVVAHCPGYIMPSLVPIFPVLNLSTLSLRHLESFPAFPTPIPHLPM